MIGKTISHYEILDKLGEGGMGVVYKAHDTHLDRFVAIKILPPEKVANPDRKRRFVQEARSASALNHPNIVTIYDIDSADGVDFIVMEYVAGKTLDELIPKKGMRLNEALRYSVQVAEALTTAHGVGIVHRDLKPSNVMAGDDGRVRVLDFGLAKLTEADPAADETRTALAEERPRTEEGTILGTASYMSPEQAQGKPVDARSDIFNFGALLYEMVTGQRAFRGDSAISTLGAIIHKDPAPLGTEVPHDLERLITRCLRKDPERRFQHMKDLKVELEELKEESDSGTLTVAAHASRPAFRWGLTAAIVATVVVLAVAGWLWFSRSNSTVPEASLVAVPLTSFPGFENGPTFSPDGNEVAFAWAGENRDNADIYVQLTGSGTPQRLTTDPAIDFSPVWSPDGREIAFVRDLGQNRLAVISIPSRSGPERRLAEVQGSLSIANSGRRLSWHPDGEHLAVADAGGLILLSTETGEKKRLTTRQGRPHTHPAFSPDGRSLVFSQVGNYAGDLYVLSLDDASAPLGEPVQITSGMGNPRFPVWTPDGSEIVFSAESSAAAGLWRMEVSGPGTPRRLAVGEGGDQPALSRDGSRLAYLRWAIDENIWRMELPASGTATPDRAPFIASTKREFGSQFSPDGSRIAFQSDRSGTSEIWACDSDGSDAVQITSIGSPATGTPRWSPDGQWIAFDSRPEGNADIFVVGASGGRPRQITTDSATDALPSWSRDGQWIYFVSNRTGSGQVWKIPAEGSAAPEEAVQVTQGGGGAPFESTDGKLVYYSKNEGGRVGVWQVPVEGGEETRVIESIPRWGSFAVAENGIYFIPSDAPEVRFYDFSTQAIRAVAALDESTPAGSLAVSPDGRTILYVQYDTAGSDLMLVENFR